METGVPKTTLQRIAKDTKIGVSYYTIENLLEYFTGSRI